jgi:hypothetical protein
VATLLEPSRNLLVVTLVFGIPLFACRDCDSWLSRLSPRLNFPAGIREGLIEVSLVVIAAVRVVISQRFLIANPPQR